MHRKYKTITHPNVIASDSPPQPHNTANLSSNTALIHQHPKSAHTTIDQQCSFDVSTYLRHLQNGFRQYCRADIVNRRMMVKTVENKRANKNDKEEQSSLVFFKKQIECLQQDKERWDHFNNQQKHGGTETDAQNASKISAINLHSFQQIINDNEASLLSQFKNTFHKSFITPLKTPLEQSSLKRYQHNIKTMKRKSSKMHNYNSLQLQKQNEIKPIHSTAYIFNSFRKGAKQTAKKSNMRFQNKSCMMGKNNTNILISRPIKLNTFQFQSNFN